MQQNKTMATPSSNKKLDLSRKDDGECSGTEGDDAPDSQRHTKKARHQYHFEEQEGLGVPGGGLPDSATALASAAASKPSKQESTAEEKAEIDSKISSSPSVKNGDTGDDKMDDRLTFPERLMYLLQHETEPKALWWQKDGLSFGFEPKVFTERVLNKLFPSKIKFESFIRKLNRWGFRRVPGQGLPPNGAAYKHPLFKKREPELIKSMKFGQKVEAPPKSSPFLNLDPASAAMTRAAQLPSGFERALGGQSRMANQAQTLQNLQQQQAFLQSLATNQQRQAAVAAGYLTQQQFATDALATSTEAESELRNRLLLGSMSAAPALSTSFQLQDSLPQFLQRQGSQVNPQGSQFPGTSTPTISSGLSDFELRNRLLLGSSVPPSANSSQQQQHSSEADRLAANIAVSRMGGSGLGTNSSSQVDLSSRFFLGGSAFSSNQSQRQDQSNNQLTSGILDQLTLLRQQQAMRSRDPTSELLYLLEQERQQRNQGNQDS